MTRYLGIDPGYDRTGYAIINEHLEIIICGCYQTNKDAPYWQRLDEVYQALLHLMQEFKPDVAGLEKPFTGRNVGNSSEVAGAWATAGLAIYYSGCQYLELHNTQIKAAVANGRATKSEVKAGVMLLLNLEIAPRPDDVTDALAAAICCRDKWRLMEMAKQ